MDCSPPGSSVHRILQARILEWVAISFSRGPSRPRNWTQVSCMVGRFFTDWASREALSWVSFAAKSEVGWGKNFSLLVQLRQNTLLAHNCVSSYCCPCVPRDAFWLVGNAARTGSVLHGARHRWSQPRTGPARARSQSQNGQVVHVLLEVFRRGQCRRIWQADENLFVDLTFWFF